MRIRFMEIRRQAVENKKSKTIAVCNTCTLKLVTIAYQRRPLFRLLREPLKAGMRLLCWVHRVDPREYVVRTASCYGCIRFYKTSLKEKSPLFRFLHDRMNPLFDSLLERIVTEEEIRNAKTFARSASAGEIKAGKAAEWMRGMRTGF